MADPISLNLIFSTCGAATIGGFIGWTVDSLVCEALNKKAPHSRTQWVVGLFAVVGTLAAYQTLRQLNL